MSSFMECGNPRCRLVFRHHPLSAESRMMMTVRDVTGPKPQDSYFCPAENTVTERVRHICSELRTLEKRYPKKFAGAERSVEARCKAIEVEAKRFTSTESCREKYVRFKEVMAIAAQMVQARRRFAALNNVTDEKDFPEDLRMDLMESDVYDAVLNAHYYASLNAEGGADEDAAS